MTALLFEWGPDVTHLIQGVLDEFESLSFVADHGVQLRLNQVASSEELANVGDLNLRIIVLDLLEPILDLLQDGKHLIFDVKEVLLQIRRNRRGLESVRLHLDLYFLEEALRNVEGALFAVLLLTLLQEFKRPFKAALCCHVPWHHITLIIVKVRGVFRGKSADLVPGLVEKVTVRLRGVRPVLATFVAAFFLLYDHEGPEEVAIGLALEIIMLVEDRECIVFQLVEVLHVVELVVLASDGNQLARVH